MAGLTVDQLSASVDARLDNNSQNLLLWSGSFQTKLDELGIDGINAFSGAISTSLTNLSSSVSATSTSFNARINSSNSTQTTLSASVSDDITNLNLIIDSLNDFSASITSSFNSLSASVSSTSASFSTRINTLRLDAGGVSTADFNALTQSLSGVISSSAQLNNATITNLTITNLTTINETASVVFSSGSNQFGDNLDDNHILSGSVYIVGSGSLNGYTLLTSNNTSSFLTSLNGALSSSAQVLDDSGIFSSSAQLPAGLVSASSQVLDDSGIFSSSAQLPAGLVSASSQVLDDSGIFSSSAQLPTNLISGSSQISELGFISSSTSIDTGSFATTGSNNFIGTETITGSLIISSSSDALFLTGGQTIRLGRASLYSGPGAYDGNVFLQGLQTKLYADKVVLEAASALGVEVIGKLNVTGSMGVSGSIIPAVGSGETTSSFSLGSSTAAWKDLWVSNGTINFLGADGTPQGTLSSTANGLQLGSSTISGSMLVTGSLTIVNALGSAQKVLSANGILGANYIAGNSAYEGVTSGFTSSIQPVISSYFNNYFSTVNSSPYKYQMGDLGIGTTYSYNNSTFTPAPAINVGYNPDLSFYTGSSSNIYSPGFSTIISSNNNLSGLERNEAVAYSNGINHVLAVTGSLLSRDNTTLGTKATDLTYIRGAATISGSIMISGSLTTSGSINMGELNTIGTFGNLIVGSSNVATGSAGVVIGNGSSANGQFAVSLGSSLQSDGQSSLAQGANNKALENYTHAEGQSTRATGLGAHSEGSVTLASGEFAHSEGRLTTASADYSNAKGVGTIAAGVGQLAIGKYNIADNTTSLFVIGNGVDGSNRKDIVNVSTSSVSITGSLAVSSSNNLTWYTPKLDIYNPDASDVCSFQLNKYDSSLGGYYNFTIRNNGDANNGTWLTNGDQPIKLMTATIQLSGNNGDPGVTNVIGTMNVTGSVVLVPQGAPSSPASGSLYFSSADSHFYGWNGLIWKQLDN